MLTCAHDLGVLKKYLEKELQPLSDADPAVLSEYVISLLKQNKAREDLMAFCKSQLVDFLHTETSGFIGRLFAYLDVQAAAPSQGSDMDTEPRQDARPDDEDDQREGRFRKERDSSRSLSPRSDRHRYSRYDRKGDRYSGTRRSRRSERERTSNEVAPDNDRHFKPRSSQRHYDSDRKELSFLGHSKRGFAGGPNSRGRSFASKGFGGRFSGSEGGGKRFDTCLLIRNIPEGNCSTEQVTEFFERFGQILKVTVDTEQKQALVQFADHAQAKAAHTNPDPIFDNRFVKVYWHHDNDPLPAPPQPLHSLQYPSAFPNLSVHAPLFEPKPTLPLQSDLQAQQKKLALLKEKERSIQKCLDTQKLLTQLLNSGTLNDQESQAYTAQLKQVTDTIESLLKTPLPAPTPATAEPGNTPATSEMEMAVEAENDRPALQAQLDTPKQEAALLGMDPSQPTPTPHLAYGGRGGYKGRGRGAWHGARGAPFTHKIDHRQSQVVIRDLPEVSEAVLRSHFEVFGAIQHVYTSSTGPKLGMIQFSSKAEAEQAVQHGTQLADGTALNLSIGTDTASPKQP